ncbi:unnamed protein product [Durusdinium trenchii]|uniref:DUF6314 domain-containing protein n=1 Tax=Durusdinium trenchii TaxID=1381693 RepID=A0ABP0IWV1_9DINO
MAALRNGDALRGYLLGRWSVKKRFDYRTGGGRGELSGIASFEPCAERPEVLMYEERGTMSLEGLPKPVEAYRLYCFNTGVWPVEVYFVDDPTKKHLPSLLPELPVHTSFFVPLSFDAGGHFRALSPESFEWNWSVEGPQKDGAISATYQRVE